MSDTTQRVKGKANEAVGKAKVEAGKKAGDRSTQAKGAAQAVKGKAQDTMGKAKGEAKKATR